jgi:hypothetical protein
MTVNYAPIVINVGRLTHRNCIHFAFYLYRGVFTPKQVDGLTDLDILNNQARLIFLIFLR